MLEGVSTSDLLMYAGIFVLAIALIVLVLWVSKISSRMAALKQALMIEQRKIEEIERQMGFSGAHAGTLNSIQVDMLGQDAKDPIDMQIARGPRKRTTRTAARGSAASLADLRKSSEMGSDISTGDIGLDDEYIGDAAETALVLSDAQMLRQQEQMQRISRARERQAKLKKKHSDEMSAELRRKREIARQREEQVRSFQQQQEALRQRIALEQAELAAEEERINKLRARAAWSGPGAVSARPRTRVSSARLEERRQAQLRRKAEEILQTRLGNAGEMNNFGDSIDFR